MRSEQQMMDLILDAARKDDRIRAVYLNGSRTNPNVPKDKYQDFDVVYAVSDIAPFSEDNGWLSDFGPLAIMQEPSRIDLAFGHEPDPFRRYTRLMLFADGNRIDLTVAELDLAVAEYTKDSLTLPLLDKDGILPQIPPPSDRDYWVNRPTEAQFQGNCNEFWWCLNNVAKGVNRDELPYVMEMFNVYVRQALMRALDWSVGAQTGFSVSTGKSGKFLKRYLSAERYEALKKTYPDGDYARIWEAVFASCSLFSEISREIAAVFGYRYLAGEEEGTLRYLRAMREEWKALQITEGGHD